MQFRKKPVVIDAVQFNPIQFNPGQMFMEWPVRWDERGAYVEIPTSEGTMRADPGDWIITGVKGERYPCKPDVFAMTYEPVPHD